MSSKFEPGGFNIPVQCRMQANQLIDLGRGLARFQALLLELSFELRTQERLQEPGRQRVGVSGRKKRRERRRKESKSREAAGETSGKCQDLSIWKRDRGLYLDCHNLQ